MRAIRQGDVMLVRLPGLPEEARRRKEATLRVPGENGHAHDLKGADLFEANGRPLAAVASGETALLEHDEHPAVDVPSGIWEVRTPQAFRWPESTQSPETDRTSTPSSPARVQGRSVPHAD